ncbi:MAG TPA: hypothetical protein VGR35_08510 [Tepidisphaeraceae bacterium]|nr:hypothetical protein [Tepidisphaeraceae bacterium]
MSEAAASFLRDFIYLDGPRVRSLAAQLRLDVPAGADRAADERLLLALEPVIAQRGNALEIDGNYDFARWTPESFVDGRFLRASGVMRLLDFAWLSAALGGLPAVLRKMSKLEMDALRNSEEGRRMSKSALQQRSQENQVAISKVEEFKADELGDVVRKLYGDVVRVKLRSSPTDHPQAVLVGSASAEYFYDTPAALSQKYGIEVDAGWTVLGQLNVPNPAPAAQPLPTGNRMEDSFEQIALLMNNAFRMASAPQWPNVSFTPLAIYRTC